MCLYDSTLWSSPNHIPMKYRSPIEKMSHLGLVHTKTQVLSLKSHDRGQSVHSQPSRARKLGLTTSHAGVPSPKSQLWHGCLHGNTFRRRGLTLVLRSSWVKQKARPNSQHKSLEYSCTKWTKIQLLWSIINHALIVSWSLKVWDFASMSGFDGISGTWDPMWTNPSNPSPPYLTRDSCCGQGATTSPNHYIS